MRKYSEETLKEIFGDFDPEEVMKNEKETFEWYKSRGADLTYFGNWQRDYAKLTIEMAELQGHEISILDVGCSTAINLRGIDELNIFRKIYGVDISNYMIDTIIPEIHKDYLWNADTVVFHGAPSHDLSCIRDNSIDFLTCSHMLEHIETVKRLEKTLKEFKRVTHKDSKLLFVLPTAKEENADYKDRPDVSPLHHLAHTTEWWEKKFAKLFKSENESARGIFRNSPLKPDRDKPETFYDAYWRGWTVFRYVHK
jgi:ubiquinone/menaquinone biosynthesis C-methylase UbiE